MARHLHKVFGELMNRPSMQAAFRRAKELAKEKNQTFVLGESTPAKVVPGKLVRDEMGVPRISEEIIPGETAKLPVASLHKIKKALDDVINTPERFIGIGESERAAALSTRAEFLKWLGDKSKAYDFARSEHARLSTPINSMEVGRVLENALASPIGSGERAAVFSRAMTDAPKTIKSATGMVRQDNLESVVGPTKYGWSQNVLSDLTRKDEYSRLAKAGMTEAKQMLGESVKSPEGLISGYLSRPISIARNIIIRLHGGATEKTLQQLAEDMLDPRKVAELMRNASPAEKFELSRHLERLRRLRNPLIVGTTTEPMQ
jgi:hypothetical protein